MIVDELVAAETMRQINSIRFANGQAANIGPALDTTIKRVERILGNSERPITKTQYDDLVELYSDYYLPELGEYSNEILATLPDFAETQTTHEAESIGGITSSDEFDPTIPIAAAVVAAALLIKVPGKANETLREMVSNYAPNQYKLIKTSTTQAFTNQSPAKALLTNIRGPLPVASYKNAGGLMAIARTQAGNVAQTAYTTTATSARLAVWAGNEKIVTGYKWVSILDNRTSMQCAALDGTEFYFRNAATEEQPRPPIHYNCLIGDTNVSTCSSVSRVFKRWYEGIAIEITTKSGRTITITPNHPILTSRGWLKAELVNCGDELITINDRTEIANHYKDSVEAKISDIFSSANVSSNSSFVSECPPTTKNFHGDMTDGEVNIIEVDRLAWSDVKSVLNKDVENGRLISRARITGSFHSPGPLDFTAPCDHSTGRSFVGSLCKRFFLVGSRSIHSSLLLLGSVAKAWKLFFKEALDRPNTTIKPNMRGYASEPNSGVVCGNDRGLLAAGKGDGSRSDCNTAFLENSSDGIAAAIKSISNGSQGKPAFVEFDDVVSVTVKRISEHVYNLENENNWYLSNGIVTHNCRSTTTPIIDGRYSITDDGGSRIAKGAKGSKEAKGMVFDRVRADTNYYKWLQRQPAWLQDSALGEERGKIFRNAGLKPQQFAKASVDQFYQPLTIEQMSKSNAKVRDYLSRG